MNKDTYFEQFTKPVRRTGKIALMLSIICSFIGPIYVGLAYDSMASWKMILAGLVMVWSTDAVYYFVEPISYFPTLGEAGSYMSFLAGSISTVRLPASAGAQDAVGVQPGTPKGELVSVIGIAASVIASLVLSVLAVIFGQLLLDFLPDVVVSALGLVVPAAYGSLIASYFKAAPAVGIFALIVAFILNFTNFLPGTLKMIVAVILCVAFGIMYQKNKEKKMAEAAASEK